jgi:hypothetical protein
MGKRISFGPARPGAGGSGAKRQAQPRGRSALSALPVRQRILLALAVLVVLVWGIRTGYVRWRAAATLRQLAAYRAAHPRPVYSSASLDAAQRDAQAQGEDPMEVYWSPAMGPRPPRPMTPEKYQQWLASPEGQKAAKEMAAAPAAAANAPPGPLPGPPR